MMKPPASMFPLRTAAGTAWLKAAAPLKNKMAKTRYLRSTGILLNSVCLPRENFPYLAGLAMQQ
jgi:hypothetical protein